MRRQVLKRFLRNTLVVLLLLAGAVAIEVLAHRRLDPAGRFSTLSGYLAWRPGEQRFASTVDPIGQPHVIAYGPQRSWLLLASGPSAYVFDVQGRLVDWSADVGDDPAFADRWNAQRQPNLTREAVQQLAATQPVP